METVPNSLDMNSSSVATGTAGIALPPPNRAATFRPLHQLRRELLLLQISQQNLVVDILDEIIYGFPNERIVSSLDSRASWSLVDFLIRLCVAVPQMLFGLK